MVFKVNIYGYPQSIGQRVGKMSELDAIKAIKMPNTVKTICEDLKALAINEGDAVLVHSSLSSIGWVCGGATAVISALLQAVGQAGTIVMPAHSGDLSDPAEWSNPPVPAHWISEIYENMPAFDAVMTPTRGMGRIAELFRSAPGTVRSNHPQVSFSANGKLSQTISANHALTPQLGMDSPLGKSYELNSKVLLLGVGYDSCTSFHLGEAQNDKMPKKRMGAAVFENGQRVWKWFDDFAYNSDDFEQLGKDFEKNTEVTISKIGNAECRVFNMRDGVDFAKKWIAENRF